MYQEHCNPLFFSSNDIHKFLGNVKLKWEKDLQKIELLKENGYEVLVIWEMIEKIILVKLKMI